MEVDIALALRTLQEMLEGVVVASPRIVVGLIVLLIFYFVGRGVNYSISRLSGRARVSPQAALALGRLAQWTIVIIGLLVGLVVVFPSFRVGELVGILGISSVAIGFAFRDIAQNFLAGILLLLSEPFSIGDQIVVNKYEGTVVNIETRATTIRTYDGRLAVIPNSALFTDSVIVNTAFSKRRLEHDIGISYEADLDLARQIILETVRRTPGILADPAPEVLVIDLADFSVILRVRWWIQPSVRLEAVETRDNVLRALKETLPARGIDLPFPTQQIVFRPAAQPADN